VSDTFSLLRVIFIGLDVCLTFHCVDNYSYLLSLFVSWSVQFFPMFVLHQLLCVDKVQSSPVDDVVNSLIVMLSDSDHIQ